MKSPLAHPPRLPAVETGRDFFLFKSFPSNVVFYQEYAAANGVGQDEKLTLPEI